MKEILIHVEGRLTDLPVLVPDDSAIAAVTADVSRPGLAAFRIPDNATGGASVMMSRQTGIRLIYPPTSGSFEANVPPVRPPEAVGELKIVAQATRPAGQRVARLRAQDDSLADAAGQRVVLGLSTDFQLFQRWLNDEQVDTIIDERIAAGSQGVRFFCTCDFLFKLDPRQHADFYGRLREFVRVLASKAQYAQVTCMADMGLGNLPSLDQQRHWAACCDALADEPNVLFAELGNETFKNGIDPTRFSRPARAPLTCAGSFVDGMTEPAGWGEVMSFHPRRDWKWWFTVAATAQELRQNTRKPVWIGEPIGAADHDERDRRASDPRLFEKLGLSIGGFAAGGVFHSDAGLTSARWTDRERECAEAFFRGMHR
jgi:hypothetical protein